MSKKFTEVCESPYYPPRDHFCYIKIMNINNFLRVFQKFAMHAGVYPSTPYNHDHSICTLVFFM